MKVLVVAAHPDDDAIGCGGTLIRHAREGDDVHSLYLTSGENGRPGEDAEETAKIREDEAWRASQYLMTKGLHFLRSPDGKLQADIDSVNAIVKLCRELDAEIVYAPSLADGHADHRAAAQATKIAVRELKDPPEVLMYEVWTPLTKPDRTIDITSVIGDKIGAIRSHRSQCDRTRFDEAAYALARYRGELHNRPQGPFAEVFEIMGEG